MKKKTKKAKRITKQTQLRVRTGIKSGYCNMDACEQDCLDGIRPCPSGRHSEIMESGVLCGCFLD